MQKMILFLAGPTAVGKTEVALELSKKIPLEAISCDSMQVYKEINIASSKPTEKILKKVPHHLINTVSVNREYNVADFRRATLKAIKQIHQKNKIPLIVGGSGLYMSVILDGIFNGAQKDSGLRMRLQKEADKFGSRQLYDRLKNVDPQAAAKIHPHDLKRLIRALEVYELTKKPISNLQNKRNGIWGKFDIRIFGLMRNRDKLYERINQRVDQMFKKGVLKEIKSVLDKPVSLTASYCLGVKEIKGFLEGQYDLAEAQCLIKQNSRRYAKKQLTWLRKDKRINWIKVSDEERPRDIAKKILFQLQK
jgi:tRNA dimethylallyltransferase